MGKKKAKINLKDNMWDLMDQEKHQYSTRNKVYR